MRGKWHYLEHDWISSADDYAFKPPGEVRDGIGRPIAEVFYSDRSLEMTFSAYVADIPIATLEWIIATAKGRLAGQLDVGYSIDIVEQAPQGLEVASIGVWPWIVAMSSAPVPFPSFPAHAGIRSGSKGFQKRRKSLAIPVSISRAALDSRLSRE
ncbi:MAG TPA: hypothetical protein VKQ29_08405 [Aliidongia sp.]|nr:hypothetical protein [Aliidongia sp.]